MIRFLMLFSWCAVVTLVLVGCMDNPTSVGASLLPPSDFPVSRIDTVYAQRDSTGFNFINSSGSAATLIGINGGYESWGMIQFDFTGLPDSLRGIPIVSASVQLQTTSVFGSAGDPVTMTAYRLTYFSTSDSLTLDSLKTFPSQYYGAQIGKLNATTYGEKDSIVIPITDTTAIRSAIDTATSTNTNTAILLRPSNANCVRGFGSPLSGTKPQLIVQFQTSQGTAQHVFSASAARFVASVAPSLLSQTSQNVYVQNGLSYRAFMEFDLSPLQPHLPAAINRANLELTLNTAASSPLSPYTNDSLFAYFVHDDGHTERSVFSTLPPHLSSGSRQTTYSIPITPFVQEWLRPGRTTRRLVVGGYAEISSLDRFALFGSHSVQATKPRIIVTYTPVQ